MLSVQAIIELLNSQGKGYKTPPFLVKWRGIYFGMSLHTTGACPAFRLLNNGAAGKAKQDRQNRAGWIFPTNFYGWQYQQLFELYLLNRHPREAEETLQWRLSQYRPFQREPLLKCMNIIIGALFQDSNYSIKLEDKDDNDYIWGNNFNGMNLIDYVKSNFQWIVDDPNGRFITIPKEPYYATTTSKIEPRVYFIPTKDIISLTDDEIIFNIYDIAWVINNQGYFRFKKDANGQYIHIDEAHGGYYAHMMGRQPNIVAGGNWNTQGFYEGWLNAAKPVLDESVGSRSSLQLVNKEASHPFIIEASTECPDCNPSGMNMVSCEVSNEFPNGVMPVRCSTCGGSHSISHNPGDRLIAEPEDMDKKLIQIVNPDVDINKFHLEYVNGLYNDIMRALHLNYIDQAQSGVAKDKDLESRYQFLSNINNDIFDRIISGLLTDILSLRNVEVKNGDIVPAPTAFYINKPSQFAIKTSFELLQEFKESTEANIPDYVRQAQLEDYIDKQFGSNDVLKRKSLIINWMDPMAVTTEADKQSRVLNGAMSRRDYQKSVMLSKMLDDIIREKGAEWFINADYTVVDEMVTKAFALIPEVEATPKAETSQVKLTG